MHHFKRAVERGGLTPVRYGSSIMRARNGYHYERHFGKLRPGHPVTCVLWPCKAPPTDDEIRERISKLPEDNGANFRNKFPIIAFVIWAIVTFSWVSLCQSHSVPGFIGVIGCLLVIIAPFVFTKMFMT